MDTVSIESRSEAKTRKVGALIGAQLAAGDVIALRGELGAGKTTLVRGLVDGTGAPGSQVRSPTFVLMCRYEGGRVPVVHVDAYRLRGAHDLYDLGLDEVLDPEAALAVEWPERVEGALPLEHLEVVLEHLAPTRRRILLRPRGDRAEALLRSLGPELVE